MNGRTFFALAFAVAACSSHSDSDSSSKPTAEQHEHEMESMSPQLARFHDLLAPHWHAPPGTARRQTTCEDIGDFKKRAADVPNAKELVAAVAALESACMSKDADAAFDPAFAKVHDAFHHLLDAGKP